MLGLAPTSFFCNVIFAVSFLQYHFCKVILIRRIILIFRFGQNHRHRPHSCPCKQQKCASPALVDRPLVDPKCAASECPLSIQILSLRTNFRSLCIGLWFPLWGRHPHSGKFWIRHWLPLTHADPYHNRH